MAMCWVLLPSAKIMLQLVQDLNGGNVLLVEGDPELSPARLRAKV